MPNLATVPAGAPLATHAAAYVLASVAPAELGHTVILVPNHRSVAVLRIAFQQQLKGKASLLPYIFPLADIEPLLVNLLGEHAFTALASIPPAMDEAEQRYTLARQILAFEQKRMGGATLAYALALADRLMELQDQCARAGIELTQDKLRQLYHKDFADHWQQALLFLGILTETWPQLERERGRILASKREVMLLQVLSDYWQHTPPDCPVFAVGSTASQHATAQLLKTIADTPKGHVILPGIDPAIDKAEWESIGAGHPFFHLKALLQLWPIAPDEVKPLVKVQPDIWLDALTPTAHIPQWRERPLAYSRHLKLIPCAHAEEEARVISLLLRERLESGERVALITPDERLMARVASHMKRYHIQVDRLNAGSLATTQTGSLWLALTAAITEPERSIALRSLFHHPLLNIDPSLLQCLERGWHGANRRRAGQLPRHDPAWKEHPDYAALTQWVKSLAQLSRQQHRASGWVKQLSALLALWIKGSGQGHEAIVEQLETLGEADHFGAIEIEDFAALLEERFTTKWRDAGLNTAPNLFMLTPVEARLEHFDRVILANMQESIWPGSASPNPWLNRAAQQALGLPTAEEDISRMAHDVLMLGSAKEVFLTYPIRDKGSPTTRSRFIERLVTLLATHGVNEEAITASEYIAWANAREGSDTYAPEQEVKPRPKNTERPRRLPVTDLDKLFTDPFSIYARQVLGLRRLKDIDAAPEASDFGSITHKAIEVLTQHWNTNQRPATNAELNHITENALRDFSERPNIDLFWRTRLRNGLGFVNGLETQRRAEPVEVMSEQDIEQALSLPNAETVTLYGRLDRLERRAKGASVIDYKTGNLPTKKDILEGRSLQLLVYAMLLGKAGEPTETIEYWALPKLGEAGAQLCFMKEELPLEEIENRLSAALMQMLADETPFLARPIQASADERFENDYDGISRYDEWAG